MCIVIVKLKFNTMKTKNILRVGVAFWSAVFLASCGGSSVYDMTPSDAQFVVKVDARSLLEKTFAEETGDVKVVLNELKNACDEFESKELTNIVKAVIDDPRSSGVNFSEPIVISGTADLDDEEFDVYVALPLADSKKFKEVVEAFYEESKEIAENSYYCSEPKRFTLDKDIEGYYLGDGVLDEDVCLGLTKNAAVFYLSSEGLGENLKDGKSALNDLFAQKNGCEASGIKEFKELDKDFAVWFNGEEFVRTMMKEYKYALGSYYKDLSAISDLYENFYYVLSLNFEKGKTVLECTYGGSKELAKIGEKYYASPSDKYFKYMPKNSFAIANLGLSSKLFVDTWGELMEQEELAPVLESVGSEYGVDENFLKGLPGTITAAVAVSSEEEVPAFAVVAECDKKVFELLERFVEDLGFEEDGSAYVYEDYSGNEYYLAYVDGAILFMDSSVWNASKGKALKENYKSASTSSVIAKGGMVVDFSVIPEEYLEEIAYEMDMESGDLLDLVSSIDMTYDKSSVRIVWNANDKKSYILQKLMGFVADEM